LAQLERSYRLTAAYCAGVSCDGDGLFVGATALLERPGQPGGAAEWRPRPLADLNGELTRCYGLPVELSSRLGGLATVASALNKGDLARAQIAALHLQLPDPPGLAKGSRDEDEFVELARHLHASGLLKATWDEAEHPRWPAGSPDSVGGQFAPAGASAHAEQAGGGSSGSSGTHRSADDARRTLHVQSYTKPDGTVRAIFLVNPASKVGGVVVQKVVSTETVYGAVVTPPRVGWEAWAIRADNMGTGDGLDDEWSPPPADHSMPSVATVRTITTEARFYEGITMQDLQEKYGFEVGGSGFSGEIRSTKIDPHLPLDKATPPLQRTKTFMIW
jgi:hypothetical protein